MSLVILPYISNHIHNKNFIFYFRLNLFLTTGHPGSVITEKTRGQIGKSIPYKYRPCWDSRRPAERRRRRRRRGRHGRASGGAVGEDEAPPPPPPPPPLTLQQAPPLHPPSPTSKGTFFAAPEPRLRRGLRSPAGEKRCPFFAS